MGRYPHGKEWCEAMRLFDVSLLLVSLRMSTSLILAAIGGVFSERSGVVNIGLEGMMLVGAFSGMLGSYWTGNPWMGVLAAMVSGGLLASLHAVVCIRYHANQAVSGAGMILLATGLSSFGLRAIFHHAGNSPTVNALNTTDILKSVPVIGDFLVLLPPFVYVAFAAVALAHFVIYKTPLGLRIISVGENPRAADTLGINVYAIRFGCVILSGVLAGLGGAYLSLGQLNLFQEGMSSGRGFIALAAVIMGKWTPIGAMLSCLLFGFADALQLKLQTIPGNLIPAEILLTLPYVIILLVLAGAVGRALPPAANGQPYKKAEG